jgi:ferritin-like metal-binding protein YciE
MTTGSLSDVYLDELSALYEVELEIARVLPRFAEAARGTELRGALTQHAVDSRMHLERLDLIFTHWGTRHGSNRCTGLIGIVQEADERVHEAQTVEAREAAILGGAQRIAHYEIAAYACACTHARRLNRPDEARLLQETLTEKWRADRLYETIADERVPELAALQLFDASAARLHT